MMENGTFNFNYETFELSELLNECYETINLEVSLKQIKIIKEFSEDLPKYIYSD